MFRAKGQLGWSTVVIHAFMCLTALVLACMHVWLCLSWDLFEIVFVMWMRKVV